MNKPFELQFLECLNDRYKLPKNLEWRWRITGRALLVRANFVDAVARDSQKLDGFSRFELSAGCWVYADGYYVDLAT